MDQNNLFFVLTVIHILKRQFLLYSYRLLMLLLLFMETTLDKFLSRNRNGKKDLVKMKEVGCRGAILHGKNGEVADGDNRIQS